LANRLDDFATPNLDQYLELLDWTGRQVRPENRGQIPAELLPILPRLRLPTETWVETVLYFGRWFRLAAGRVDCLAAEAARRGRRWLQAVSHSCAALAEEFAEAIARLRKAGRSADRGLPPKSPLA
jgi:hypothetical protein